MSLENKLPNLPIIAGLPILPSLAGLTISGILPLPSNPTPSKGRLSSIGDSQTTKLTTGWDWFQKKDGKDYEDIIQVVRTGAIGDNSCFYHSTIKATCAMYQNEADILAYSRNISAATGVDTTLYLARQRFADNFRRAIAEWFMVAAINPITRLPYTAAEAARFLNTRPRGLATILRNDVRDPTSVRFNPFTGTVERKITDSNGDVVSKPYGWAHNIFEDLIDEDEKVRTRGANTLITNTVGMDDDSAKRATAAIIKYLDTLDGKERGTKSSIEASHAAAVEAARFTPMLLQSKLAEKGITRENVLAIQDAFKAEVAKAVGDERAGIYFARYYRIINDNLAAGKTANEALVQCQLLKAGTLQPTVPAFAEFITYARTYVEGRRKMIDFIRTTFGDPTTIYNSAYPMAIQNKVVNEGVDAFLAMLRGSINGRTGLYYSETEIATMLDSDPRTGSINDPEILALPININYFILNEGINIYRYNDVDDHGVHTFQLKQLLRVVSPVMDDFGRVTSRRDAGEDDIIAMMPFILGINIYLVHLYGDHIRVYRTFFNRSEDSDINISPSIVIHSTGGHFEVLGTADEKGVVKTCFEPTNPFVVALNEYTHRLNLGKADHDALYHTLKISKIKSPILHATLPMPLPLPSNSFSIGGPSAPIITARPTGPSDKEIEYIRLQMDADEDSARAIWRAQNSPAKYVPDTHLPFNEDVVQLGSKTPPLPIKIPQMPRS